MLQLQAKEVEIYRVSKIIAQYNVKAKVTSQEIVLDGNIKKELLDELCNVVTIKKIQNFVNEITTQNESIIRKETEQETISTKPEESVKAEQQLPHGEQETTNIEVKKQKLILEAQLIQNYDLIYRNVKYGEIYLCDFGEPYAHEIGYIRPAIVVQNNATDINSANTIVLPCSKRIKEQIPTRYICNLYEEMLEGIRRLESAKSSVLVDAIRTVDKTRLRKYLGTMKPEFMDKIQDVIDITLARKKENETR